MLDLNALAHRHQTCNVVDVVDVVDPPIFSCEQRDMTCIQKYEGGENVYNVYNVARSPKVGICTNGYLYASVSRIIAL